MTAAMRAGLAICLVFATLVAAAAAARQDLPSPTPLSFTAKPKQLQWRIGFNLGNAIVLEAPELNPQNREDLALEEAERLIPSGLPPFTLALLPASKTRFQADRLVNPKEWTIVDLLSKTDDRMFQGLGIFMGNRMTSNEGGFHLVSMPAMPEGPFVGMRKEPAPEDLVFGFAGPRKGTLRVHTRLSETKWENLLPVEDPAGLPGGYEHAKELLDDGNAGDKRFLFGTSIEAAAGKQLNKLWLLNYSHPDTTIGSHPWGIFLERGGQLEPLYIYKPGASDRPYVAYLTAAVDLTQDGADELVVEASYRNGTAFKVISNSGGKYREIFTSYFRGTL